MRNKIIHIKEEEMDLDEEGYCIDSEWYTYIPTLLIIIITEFQYIF